MAQVVDAVVVGAGRPDGRVEQRLLVGGRLGEHCSPCIDRATAAGEAQVAHGADGIHVHVWKAILERARAGRELVIGAEGIHVRRSRHEEFRSRAGELPRRFRELDVEADQRPDIDTGEADDPKRFARPEHALLGAEELRLPVHGLERAVAVDTRHGVGKVPVGGSLGETHDDSGGRGYRGVGDRTELGTIDRQRRLRKQRELVAAQEKLGEDGDVDRRMCGKRRDRSSGVRQRLPRYRRQLGKQRAHTARLFALKQPRREPNGSTLRSRSTVDVLVEGYFSEDAAIRRIARESVLMLGGPRALLMQAAHPLVAAGIVDHSHFQQDPWRRLARTMTALYTIVFGTQEQAERIGAITRAAHGQVHGWRGRHAYTAADPRLMLWVHSTLVDTGLAMYETYVRRVEPATAEEFYEQMKIVATVFGVPPDVHPPTLADFRSYQRSLLESGEVRVGADARAVAATVLSPPVPLPLRPALRALAAQSAGLLPLALREQYGLRWTRADGLALRASSQSCRRLVPLLPPALRRTERLPLRVLTAFAAL